MSTVPVTDPDTTDMETQEILSNPELRKSLEALDDPEDREDLIDHLKAMKRYREGKDKGTPWEQVKATLGL